VREHGEEAAKALAIAARQDQLRQLAEGEEEIAVGAGGSKKGRRGGRQMENRHRLRIVD